eukprot:ANDGO_08390.mRNA.1 hypothetical protein
MLARSSAGQDVGQYDERLTPHQNRLPRTAQMLMPMPRPATSIIPDPPSVTNGDEPDEHVEMKSRQYRASVRRQTTPLRKYLDSDEEDSDAPGVNTVTQSVSAIRVDVQVLSPKRANVTHDIVGFQRQLAILQRSVLMQSHMEPNVKISAQLLLQEVDQMIGNVCDAVQSAAESDDVITTLVECAIRTASETMRSVAAVARHDCNDVIHEAEQQATESCVYDDKDHMFSSIGSRIHLRRGHDGRLETELSTMSSMPKQSICRPTERVADVSAGSTVRFDDVLELFSDVSKLKENLVAIRSCVNARSIECFTAARAVVAEVRQQCQSILVDVHSAEKDAQAAVVDARNQASDVLRAQRQLREEKEQTICAAKTFMEVSHGKLLQQLEDIRRLDAKFAKVRAELGPRCTVFVIDCSGSMMGASLDAVKEACQSYCKFRQSLEEGNAGKDSVMVVRFSHEAEVHLPYGMLADLDRVVAGLDADGGTNFDSAMAVTLVQMSRISFKLQDMRTVVIFLSDGESSVCTAERDVKEIMRLSPLAGRIRFHSVLFGTDTVSSAPLHNLANAALEVAAASLSSFGMASSFERTIDGVMLKDLFVRMAES